MDGLWQWVTMIAGIGLIAVLVDLILPKNSLYKSAQMVCGLVILSVIADPLLGVLASETFPIEAHWSQLLSEEASETWEDGIERGRMQHQQQEITLAVQSVSGFSQAEVTVHYMGERIAGVDINLPKEAMELPGDIPEKIYEFLQYGYDISPNQVCIR